MEIFKNKDWRGKRKGREKGEKEGRKEKRKGERRNRKGERRKGREKGRKGREKIEIGREKREIGRKGVIKENEVISATIALGGNISIQYFGSINFRISSSSNPKDFMISHCLISPPVFDMTFV